MNDKIKQHLVAYNASKGWGLDDGALLETVIESDALWEGTRDENRWYTLVPTVVDVNGMFLIFDSCHVKGEASDVDDCIGGYKLENIKEAVSKEVTVTIYETIE